MMIRSKVVAFAAAALVALSMLPVVAPTAASADSGVNVYTTPGEHTVNGRRWRTTCETYTADIFRCRAEIWATQAVAQAGGGYKAVNGWVFNNLTYLPAPKALWLGNPLATSGKFSSGGRQWKTECGSTWTGPNACRSFIRATAVHSRTFQKTTEWVFNNVVMFGETRNPPSTVTPQNCTIAVNGVKVNLQATQQTATVVKNKGNSSTWRATATMIKRTPGTACGVTTVFTENDARYGSNGTAPAATRRQNSGKTPSGTFTVKDAFGTNANPGTALSWRDVNSDSYWVLDGGTHHNQWRQGAQGGFRKAPSEKLDSFGNQYTYAAVIDFNRNPVRAWQGGAIFLHVHGLAATGSCVSISQANMVKFLNNATPGDTITIV